MAQKKNNPTKPVEEESMLNKIAGDAAYMAGKMVVAKNDLVEMAGGAIETVKTAVKKITTKKNVEPGELVKAAVAKVEKKVAPANKAAKKVAKKVVKKAAPAKKAVKAAIKKVAKKTAPARKAAKAAVKKVVKKAAPAKKAIKKTAKKIARKR